MNFIKDKSLKERVKEWVWPVVAVLGIAASLALAVEVGQWRAKANFLQEEVYKINGELGMLTDALDKTADLVVTKHSIILVQELEIEQLEEQVMGGVGLLPRGLRNNNPGNIVQSKIKWKGEIPCIDRHVCFIKPEYGIRALVLNLLAYESRHGIHTIDALVNRWAEGNRGAYAAYLATNLGIATHTEFTLRGNPVFLANMVESIIEFENGYSPYDFDMIYSIAVMADWQEGT